MSAEVDPFGARTRQQILGCIEHQCEADPSRSVHLHAKIRRRQHGSVTIRSDHLHVRPPRAVSVDELRRRLDDLGRPCADLPRRDGEHDHRYPVVLDLVQPGRTPRRLHGLTSFSAVPDKAERDAILGQLLLSRTESDRYVVLKAKGGRRETATVEIWRDRVVVHPPRAMSADELDGPPTAVPGPSPPIASWHDSARATSTATGTLGTEARVSAGGGRRRR